MATVTPAWSPRDAKFLPPVYRAALLSQRLRSSTSGKKRVAELSKSVLPSPVLIPAALGANLHSRSRVSTFLRHSNQLSSFQSHYRFHQGSENILVPVWVCSPLWHSPCFTTLPSALSGDFFLQLSLDLSPWNCWHKHPRAGAALPSARTGRGRVRSRCSTGRREFWRGAHRKQSTMATYPPASLRGDVGLVAAASPPDLDYSHYTNPSNARIICPLHKIKEKPLCVLPLRGKAPGQKQSSPLLPHPSSPNNPIHTGGV